MLGQGDGSATLPPPLPPPPHFFLCEATFVRGHMLALREDLAVCSICVCSESFRHGPGDVACSDVLACCAGVPATPSQTPPTDSHAPTPDPDPFHRRVP